MKRILDSKRIGAIGACLCGLIMVAGTAMAVSPYDKIPPIDPTNIKPGPNLQTWLKTVPFIRDTFIVQFNKEAGLVYVLPRTLMNPVASGKGLRFVRYEYPDLYAPKDEHTLPQAILDIQKVPFSPASTADQEIDIASQVVTLEGTDYIVRLATSKQYPKLKKDYFPLVLQVVSKSLAHLDTSKPFYGEGKIPRSLIDRLNGRWSNSKGKEVLTIQGPRLNGEELEAVYNVEAGPDSLTMDMISIKEDQVHCYHVELKDDVDQFGQRSQALYVNGERTTTTRYSR